MTINEKIVDYNENEEEINKWLSLKGEKKYLEYIAFLESKDIEVNWIVLDDTFRYDKRLLFNIFKYFSFFEDYLRAIVWNCSEITYKHLESSVFKDVAKEIIEHTEKYKNYYLKIDRLATNYLYVNYIRNRVCHNKIILTAKKNNKDLRELLILFKDCLPTDYVSGFVKEINGCSKGLCSPGAIVIL